MRLFHAFQQRLGWRLLLSYLLVLTIGVVVLDVTAELQTPHALTRNIARLQALQEQDPALEADLQANLSRAVHDELMVGTLAGVLAAVAASLFTTRRILAPIQAMTAASQRIAAGDYHHRIEPPSRDELGVLTESFNEMAGTLEDTERRRTELVGDLAHEVRTPLSAIRSGLEGMIDGVLPCEPDTLTALQRDVNRIQRLVQDLEELSRAEAGQVHLDLRPVAIGDLVGSVAQRLRPQYEDKDVGLHVEVSPRLPMVRADALRMTQVMVNLLGNALQYTPAGGTVTVKAASDNLTVTVSVVDTGIGLSPEQLQHVFERFYRVDRSRSRAAGGSGLGLTIARHLVQAHGGMIGASSPGLGRGCTFWFALPTRGEPLDTSHSPS
jgi:histidine kinase